MAGTTHCSDSRRGHADPRTSLLRPLALDLNPLLAKSMEICTEGSGACIMDISLLLLQVVSESTITTLFRKFFYPICVFPTDKDMERLTRSP